MVVSDQSADSTVEASEEERRMTDSTYRCDACGKVYETPEALMDHIYSVGLVD